MKLRFWVLAWGMGLVGCSARSLTDGTSPAMQGGSGGAAGAPITTGGSGALGFGGSGASPGLMLGTGGFSACGDTSSDPLNCGVCGYVCPGGLCKSRTCRSSSGGTVLITGETASGIAVDATNIYWISDLSSSHAVKRCALSGCAGKPTTVWQSSDRALWLSVAGGSIWWADIGEADAIFQCSTLGCGAVPNVFAGPQAQQDIQAFAANEAGLVWASSSGAVFSCPLNGCPSTGPTEMFTVIGEAAGYVIQDSRLFGFDLAVDGSAGFGQINHLFSCPLSGCAGSGPTILGTVDTSGVLAVDTTNAYWIYGGTSNTGFGGVTPVPPTSWQDGAVYSCSLSGCVGTPTALAQYPSWYAATALAADASGVYWTVGDADGSGDGDSASLVRCSGAGCASQPTQLATLATGSTPAIALDENNIYWFDSVLSAIMVRPK